MMRKLRATIFRLWEGDAPIDEMLSLAETLDLSVVVETKTFAGLQLSMERLQNHPIMQRGRR